MIRLCLLACILALPCFASSDVISEFELSSPGHRPQAIITGPDGNLWVTEVLKHLVLKVTPDGKITEYAVPGDKVGVLQGIAAGSDGKIWFTSREENAVRRLSVDGKFDASYELPSKATLPKSMTPGCWPREIAPGGDKQLWLAEMAANKIASISVDGTIKEFAIPTENSQPYCVVAGPDKAIWFTESTGNKIGRLDPQSGKITEFAIPTAESHTRELTPGADGNIWFAMSDSKIGRFSLGLCTTSATSLCLNGGRFQVTTAWSVPSQGTGGQGTAVPLTPNTGYFWFHDSTNVEAVVKVLDACAINSHYWVFAGGLTNSAVVLTVTDEQTGLSKIYQNPANTEYQPIQDTSAFSTCP